MPDAYLTIDDSPSKNTDALVNFLVERGVPAIFYVRGEFMEDAAGFESIVRAIDKGFLIGNHSYGHEWTSKIGFEEQAGRILKTQNLIEKAYRAARQAQRVKTFRFPYLDRGTAAWVIDFNTVSAEYREYVEKLFWEGLRVENLESVRPAQIELKNKMQDWLKSQGFEKLPTPRVTHPWFTGSEMKDAIDAMFTFSTSDWMLTPRHRGKCFYKTENDLKEKIDNDEWLHRDDSAHIILAHDDREDSLQITTSLIDYLLDQDFEFLPFSQR